MNDLERGQHVGPQPCHKCLEKSVRLVLVDLLRAGAGRRRHLTSASIEPQRVLELLVAMRQFEKDFIGELLVLEVRRLERLEEVEVEVPWRLRRRTLVGCAEEQVAPAGDLVVPPLDLVFPNLVAPDVGRQVGQFQHTGQGVEVVLVKVRVGQRFGLVLDFGVVVDGLLQVQVILVVLRVVGDELAADRLHDLLEAGFHRRPQEVAGLLRDRGEQAQAVLKLLGGWADPGPDVVGRQPVDRQAVDDTLSHRLKRLAGECLLDAVLDHPTHIDNVPDFRHGTQYRVSLKELFNFAIGLPESFPRRETDFPVNRRRGEKPAGLAFDGLFDNAAATVRIVRVEPYCRMKFSDRTVVIGANDFIIAAFNPFKRVFIPTKPPAHVSGLADLA